MKANDYVIYIFIYKKIKEKAYRNWVITHKQLKEVLRRNLSKIPNILYCEIIRELEELKLIKKSNKFKYEIVGGKRELTLNKYNYPI